MLFSMEFFVRNTYIDKISPIRQEIKILVFSPQ